jgi:hypothetical protein
MNLRRLLCLVLLASLALSPAARANQHVQPVEMGLQPLYARMTEIRKEQLVASGILQSPLASPQKKAQAKSKYQALEAEKRRIEKEISQAHWMEESSLVKYSTDTTSPAAMPGQK